MNALARQKVEILSEQGRYLILYRRKDRQEAIRKAMDYRRQGKRAELRLITEEQDMEDQAARAAKSYIGIIRIGE